MSIIKIDRKAGKEIGRPDITDPRMRNTQTGTCMTSQRSASMMKKCEKQNTVVTGDNRYARVAFIT
jgi:hypothetical protein